jgi:hypothetical protein
VLQYNSKELSMPAAFFKKKLAVFFLIDKIDLAMRAQQ